MAVLQQLADVAQDHHAAEQVDERDDAEHAGDSTDVVDHAVAECSRQDDHGGEDEDAGTVADAQQLTDGLTGKHGTGGGEAEIHQAHQDDRDSRAVDTELHPAGDHLRQAELGPLGRVQRHHRAAEQLADEQADQRPEHVAAQYHGQCAGDNCGDLQVGAQPQGELAVEATVALGLGNVIDRTAFDQGLGRRFLGLGHLTVLRCGDDVLVVIRVQIRELSCLHGALRRLP
ncbi:hypothetical protein D3C85_910140 [compost metagenome]